MERFSYKGECGVCEGMCIKAYKEELAWAIHKWLQVISYTTKKLNNKPVLNLKQYCMCCYLTLSNVF